MLLETARAGLDRGDPGVVDTATEALLREDPWEWRAVWMQGLRALAAGDATTAQASFNAVYGQVPGELAPKLALAVACERSGVTAVAENMYAVCARTDAAYTPVGAFGMARIRLAEGQRHEAVEALDLVPTTSRAFATARQRRAEILADSGEGLSTLADALRSVDKVALEPLDKARLTVSVFANALAWVRSGKGKPEPGVVIDGHQGSLRGIREGLEQALRRQAELTTDPTARVALVDRANDVRPWTVR